MYLNRKCEQNLTKVPPDFITLYNIYREIHRDYSIFCDVNARDPFIGSPKLLNITLTQEKLGEKDM